MSTRFSTQMLAQMTATSDLLVGIDDLAAVLQGLAARAREVTGADYAAIATFDDDGQLTRFVYTGMTEDQARKMGHPPSGRGLLGELVTADRPIRLADHASHPASTGWPAGHPDMSAFLGVPIRAGGHAIGSLYMTRARGGAPFDEDDELAATLLSLQAAVSVSAAMARERNGRLFLLQERGRIAHDLHDGTIQSLYALGLECDVLANRSDFPLVVRDSMRDAVVRINDLIGDIRGYITMLEAETPLTQPELSSDLAFLVRQMVPPGVDSVLNITAAALQELSARDSEDILYIAREAVSNAVRHGAPTKVAIDLRQTETETALTVIDNGVGFDPAVVRSGFGTITMRTRSERLAAHISIIGIPGMGTTVRVAIPRRLDA